MDPSAVLRLFIRFIYLWLKSADDVLVVEGALAVIQPFLSTQLQTSYFAIINNLVYYFNMWHVSTPIPHHITIKWVGGSVSTGGEQG